MPHAWPDSCKPGPCRKFFNRFAICLKTFSATARFAEPDVFEVELVKLAVLLGWIAVGPWESWDTVELHPRPCSSDFGIADSSEILRQYSETP